MDEDIRWFIHTCHECQVRLVKKISNFLTVPTLPDYSTKSIDIMLMPKAKGYWYIIHAKCLLSLYPEWEKLWNKNFKTIAKFIHEVLLSWWRAIEIIIMDNAPQYIQAVKYLAKKYNICYIRISPYNSWAQGPIERQHYNVHKAIIKAANGDKTKWPDITVLTFWAKRVSIQKSTGYSPFYITHGAELLFPFDLAEAMYLAPNIN